MAQRGRYQTHAALKTLLKGINGAAGGYWYSFGDRVYDRLSRPEELGATVIDPYLCLPLVEIFQAIEVFETGMKLTWQQGIYGFLQDGDRQFATSDGPVNTMKMQDDVWRCIMADPTLGGLVQNMEFVGGEAFAGVLTDQDYGEFTLLLQLTQTFATADLGPSA